VGGASALVVILLYFNNQLWYLNPKFHLPVLLGGIALLVVVFIGGIVFIPQVSGRVIRQALFSSAVCLATGFVALLMWYYVLLFMLSLLLVFLDPAYYTLMMGTGIVFMSVATIWAVRLVSREFSTQILHGGRGHQGRSHNHSPGHDHHHHHHDHDHNHDPAHCSHDHQEHDHALTLHAESGKQLLEEGLTAEPGGSAVATLPLVHEDEHGHEDHGHDHGWAPWRYGVLLVPVVLFLFNLPNEGFSNVHGGKDVDTEGGKDAAAKGGYVIKGFLELDRAAALEDTREMYAGRTAQISGKVAPLSGNRFQLERYKINCCAADAIPLRLVVEVTPAPDAKAPFDAKQLRDKWVEVEGIIQFRRLRGSGEYVTLLHVKAEDVGILPKMPANPFIY
jgi:uncharacterized membrane protein YcgQ (UPF0703/DUF1980 family)